MRRTSAILATLALALTLTACDAGSNSNNSNNSNNANRAAADNGNAQGRDGLVDNANLPKNANSRTVSPGTAVVTNDNGNKNTSGVRSINSNNGNHAGSNGNHNR
ncbi:MAG: hypothetical protein LC785_08595 [Acidobacteria bacterium]|nr:hypothetical protein [Acidobacteriota bacterium]MCA1641992.1 hypothetical protein [Acidobacteriota bacterium]